MVSSLVRGKGFDLIFAWVKGALKETVKQWKGSDSFRSKASVDGYLIANLRML